MIRYALSCDNAHDFEGWFRSFDDFERQEREGAIACPACGSAKVERQLMAPAVLGRGAEAPAGQLPAVPAVVAAQPAMLPDPRNAAMMEALRQLRKAALAHSEHVGDRFAEEARKIHYNEAEARGIHGKATIEEAKALAEEGIPIQPLPVLPEDQN